MAMPEEPDSIMRFRRLAGNMDRRAFFFHHFKKSCGVLRRNPHAAMRGRPSEPGLSRKFHGSQKPPSKKIECGIGE